MSSLTVGPRVGWLRRFCRFAVPWLCSTTCHVALLTSLVLAYQWTRRPDAPGGVTHAGDPEAEVSWQVGAGDETLDETAERELDSPPREEPAGDSLVREFVGDDAPEAQDARHVLNTSREISLASFNDPDDGESPKSAKRTTGAGQSENARASGPPMPAGYTRTGVFGASGVGRKFVYVFDRSASMDGHGGAPLAAAKRELIASLADLDETHQFQIIFYNERPRVFNPTGVLGRLVFGTDQNKNLAEKFVGSVTADGATRHEDALAMALKMAPDVVFFLTDADEPRMTTEQLERIARLNKGTAINTIEFGFGAEVPRENFLIKLAQQNAGQHVYVDVSKLSKARSR